MNKWKYIGFSPDGVPFLIDGIDVWKVKWQQIDGESAEVTNPFYGQEFLFNVFKIVQGTKEIRFAAGEYANCAWGFYQLDQNAA
jgi:hypothetical protein